MGSRPSGDCCEKRGQKYIIFPPQPQELRALCIFDVLQDLDSGTCKTPSDTLVLTWQNALLNRDSNSLVNIQAELFSLGEMRVAHDISREVETGYLPQETPKSLDAS